jgi:hypothetical protein
MGRNPSNNTLRNSTMESPGSFDFWMVVGSTVFFCIFVILAPRIGWVWRWKHGGPVLLNLGRYQKSGEGLGTFFFYLYIFFSKPHKEASLPWWVFVLFFIPVILIFLFEHCLPLLVTDKGFLFRNHLITWDQIETYDLAGDHTCILIIKKLPQYLFSKIVVDLPPGQYQPLQEILSSHRIPTAEP